MQLSYHHGCTIGIYEFRARGQTSKHADTKNESTTGADVSVEAPNMKLLDLAIDDLATFVQKVGNDRP